MTNFYALSIVLNNLCRPMLSLFPDIYKIVVADTQRVPLRMHLSVQVIFSIFVAQVNHILLKVRFTLAFSNVMDASVAFT